MLTGNRHGQSKANSRRNHNQYKTCGFYFNEEKYVTVLMESICFSPEMWQYTLLALASYSNLTYSPFHLQKKKISGI